MAMPARSCWGQPPVRVPARHAGPVAGVLPPYDEAVLEVVATVPAGRATTYGDVAEALRSAGWGGGPRTVGAVMARHGSAVAWWRVVRADGGLPLGDEGEAARRLRAEGTPMRGVRVHLARARADLAWVPPGPAVSDPRDGVPS